MFLPAIPANRLSRPGIFLLLVLLSVLAFGQKTREQLEKEKQDNLKRIAQAEKILKETEEEKKVTIGQLQALKNQISEREALIRSMNREITLLDNEIKDINIVVRALNSDLENMKEEYAAMIYASHKANQGYNVLTFLFSASTFNQLVMRMKYLNQYSDARKVQAEQIGKVTEELRVQKVQVEQRKEEQKKILAQQISENEKLIGLRSKQNKVVAQLTTRETEMRAEVAKRKKAIEDLDKLIAASVKAATATTSVADVANSRNFESMKKRLSWPVDNGFISAKFGRQAHPVLDNIQIENNGVSIQTKKGERVKAVTAGVVTAIHLNSPFQNVVMIRHGNYLTVYAHLGTISVKRGDQVNVGDVIGEVFTDANGVSELEFQIWKGQEKLNPEEWLVKR
jgi:murein hydrolase activator